MNIASCQCVVPKQRGIVMWPVGPLRGCQCELAGRWNLAARRTNPRRVRKVIQVQVQSRACFQACFGSRPRLGASRLPLLRKARSGRPAELVPDSPSVLSKHRSPSVLLTHLTRDGRPTASTWPPWPRPMGAPGVAGVGGPGRMTTGGNRAAGARARLHHLQAPSPLEVARQPPFRRAAAAAARHQPEGTA